MEHVVFFPAPDGSAGFRRVPTLEEAVRLVEHLRNVEGINEVSCHALTEVPLAFRTYYRVEVPGLAEPAEAAASESAQAEPAQAQPVQLVPDDVPTPAVETPPVAETQAEPQAEAQGEAVTEAPVPLQVVDDEPEAAYATATTNGRATDGAKSLGFFA